MTAKNADTIKTGGSRQDCGPSVLKSVSRYKPKFDPAIFLKNTPEQSKSFVIKGFEEALDEIDFK